VRFLSCESLLGPLDDLNLSGIHWVIVGGESGPEAWAASVRDQCLRAWVPFFFKQWGGVIRRQAGRLLQGRAGEGLPALGHPPGITPPAASARRAESPGPPASSPCSLRSCGLRRSTKVTGQ
jgi:hypothetical protein